jgi:hypothetical protein
MDKRPPTNLQNWNGGDDALATLPANTGLCVAVFVTTKGTTAALNETTRLAKDLGARITVLKMEAVPFWSPVEKPPVSLRTMRNCFPILHGNGAGRSHRQEGSAELFFGRGGTR